MEPKIRFIGFSKEWKKSTIGDLFSFKNGLNKGKEFFGHGTPIINYTDVYKNRTICNSLIKGKVELNFDEINRYRVQKGDVFFTRTSETPEEVGFSSVLVDDIQDCSFSGFVLRARPITEELVPEYCGYCFSVDNIRNAIKSTCTYTTRALTNGTVLSSIGLFYPSTEEQETIASFFQHLDSLIQSTAKKIESLKQVKAASLQSMFPQEGETVPRVRFKGFEGEWKQIVMSDVGYMTAGGTPSTFEDSYWNGDINWLQSGAVQNNIILPSAVERKITKEGLSNSAAHLVQKDSVLIAITGATCANIGYLTFNSTANQSVVSVEPYRGFDSKFVYQSLMINRNQILSFKGGSAQSGVTLSNLKKMSILCPDYQEQQKIGCFFFNIEEMIMQCMTRLEKLKQIKTACLDNMFV